MNKHTFHITTFGCQMNNNDSDWLTRSLITLGFTPVPVEEAAVHILNTCSVRDKPEQKVYSEIGRIRHVTDGNPDILICVGGCVAQQVGTTLFKRFSQVRLVFGTDGIASAPGAIARLVDEPRRRISLLDFTEGFEERDALWSGADVPPAAFVSIMQGCDNFCSYCIVPYVRGRQKSRSAKAVRDECTTLLQGGAREITLLGQNVNSYGLDNGTDGTSFTDLLYQVAELPGLERLSFMTPHPKDLSPALIDAFMKLPVLTSRLHLPLQAGSDRILSQMGRRYDKARFRELVSDLRHARPGMHFSTDIIVGFPGETEEDFQETLAFMQEVGFVSSFSFIYSDRPGTKAAMLPGKVERAVSMDRLARLQKWQHDYAWQVLNALTGEIVDVLLEKPNLKLGTAGEYWQGYEGRGHTVTVRLTGPAPERGWRGAIVPIKITKAITRSLHGEQIGQAR